MGGLVEETYLPILRLVYEDPERVERDWEAAKAKRNGITRLDSPNERWKKTYGNFVRELEWACGQRQRRTNS